MDPDRDPPVPLSTADRDGTSQSPDPPAIEPVEPISAERDTRSASACVDDRDEREPADPAPVAEQLEPSAARVVETTLETPEPSPSPDTVAQEAGVLPEIRSALAALRNETVATNRILDRLHADNERLRQGENERVLQPLLRDIIKLMDDWTGMAAAWRGRDSATSADVASKCAEVADDASVILERYGVDAISPTDGEAFDRKRHRIVGTLHSDVPRPTGTVASTRRCGFVSGEKVLRFADVVVYTGGGDS